MVLKKIIKKLPVSVICRLKSLKSIDSVSRGRAVYIHPTVHFLGMANIVIGENSCISEGSWLNVNHRTQDGKAIIIGKNCFIGKRNFFSSGLKIVIGDYCLTALDCKFMGSSHIIDDPCLPYISTGTTHDSIIDIGVNCFFGAGANVLGNVQIGHGSVIGAGAHVLQNVPPFSIVIGNPGRVVKRFSFLKNQWIPVADVTKEDVASMPDADSYLSTLSENVPVVDMPWIAAGRSLGNL